MDSKSVKKKAPVKAGRIARQGSRKPLSRTAKQKQAIASTTKRVLKGSEMRIPRTAGEDKGYSVLCDACQAMFQDEDIYDDRIDCQSKVHQLTRNSIQAAVKAGCEFCGLLWDLWQTRLMMPESSPNKEEAFSSYSLYHSGTRPCLILMTICNVEDGKGSLPTSSRSAKIGDISRSSIYFDLYPTSGLLRELFCRHGGSNWQSSLGEASKTLQGSMLQISSWFEECMRGHTCTSIPARPDALFSMPSRVLDISHSDGMDYFRVDFSPAIAPYATLSHCWGPIEERKPPRLTLANRSRLKQRTSVAALPRTFQDAILVVKNIGVRYLWIDSLCIIQDSITDWQQESSRMTEVYRNALVNVAAEAATDCHAGLSIQRDNNRTGLSVLTGVGTTSSEYLLLPSGYRESIEDNPLRKRAWTFQERLLAPRQVSFGWNQVMWKCSRSEACEVFPSGYPSQHPELQYFNCHVDSALLKCINSIHSVEDVPESLWYRLVAAYTNGALTREEDKLVAIQGIARLLKSMLKDEYVAGLWRSSLAVDLLWYVHDAGLAFPKLAYRPEKYRAPSWSWASVEGPIAWWTQSTTSDPSFETRIEILDVSITLKGTGEPGQAPDSTGQIAMGYICLRGRLQNTIIDKSIKGDPGCNIRYSVDSEGNLVHYQMDDATQWREKGHVLLNLYRSKFGVSPNQTYGLMLAPDTRCPTTFRRIGSFTISGNSPSIDRPAQEEQVITLI